MGLNYPFKCDSTKNQHYKTKIILSSQDSSQYGCKHFPAMVLHSPPKFYNQTAGCHTSWKGVTANHGYKILSLEECQCRTFLVASENVISQHYMEKYSSVSLARKTCFQK